MSYRDTEFGEDFLDDIKEWIADKFEIDELYDEQEIVKWVLVHYYLDELYDKNEILGWLDANAKDYGYVKEE